MSILSLEWLRHQQKVLSLLGHCVQAAGAVSQPGVLGLISGPDLSCVLSKRALGLTLTTPNSLSLEH